MRASQLLAPTLRETPAEAEVISHQLLLRAGFIRKAAAGVYTYLPLAQRVLHKIMQIVREEMNRAGGQEITMPIIQPAELWLESGRWHVYGDELFRLKDRHGREFALGPTHEEIITDLVRNEVHSYKQLPLLLYQIANKYRDERRPRFGLMRGREFIMKDLYSFDKDEVGMQISYQKMFDAYTRIFTRLGLKFRPVEADAGAIGGSSTHEFMVLADAGEATIVYCDTCTYAANVEKAESRLIAREKQEAQPLEKIATPEQKTIDEVAAFLGIAPEQTIKTLIYHTEKGLVAAVLRGDRQVNEIKLQNLVDTLQLHLASDEEVVEKIGVAPGSIGPVGLKGKVWQVIADPEVVQQNNLVCGANEDGYHLKNVNYDRDYAVDLVADIRMVEAGEHCPRCEEGKLLTAKGIEVGQVFQLGTKYSKALNAVFLDENGKQKEMVMGCYGIGITRTMAAAIEQNHDENGIIWPLAIAPYHVVVIPVSEKDQQQREAAEKIYSQLTQLGIETVIDDRVERAGVKFKDADLIGYPYRLTVGKTLAEGKVELKERRTGNTRVLDVEEAAQVIANLVKEELARY
ncbi:prolyl-tRNA synthetase [Carboxydocella sporoproducens DSM 16521]|uniref:Proline--tRNA ligase n=2 Tax=Carboxydocella TaxID=178898 RepID=A0A1T4P765_9FIRM|nr:MULTISPECIES: proline--tRNA ligase [Carboxydocella]AVX20728.1 prolyl-tRNA synthetase [Carboxydocella thermautotrophica]AVX31147.1 prolyl-tRNA synthetase [Carboxydocella thermautotrophica]SJZ87415.1 prolyl-tRNA synthetase [Carboxydocella sporoproducens DSM 16521]